MFARKKNGASRQLLYIQYASVASDLQLKDRKRRQEGGEWEPQIFSRKYLATVPKSPPNTSNLLRPKYSSQLVTKVPRTILWNGRKATQQTRHDSELKRQNQMQNTESRPEKN